MKTRQNNEEKKHALPKDYKGMECIYTPRGSELKELIELSNYHKASSPAEPGLMK